MKTTSTKTTLSIKGMHCISCKSAIEDACKDISGVKACTVDFKSGKTIVEHDHSVTFDQLKKEIGSLGQYEVTKQ